MFSAATGRGAVLRAVALLLLASLAWRGPAWAGPDARWLLFSGGDLAASSAFVYAGGRYSPLSPIEAGGLLLEAFSGYGRYRYETGAVADGEVEGTLLLSQAGAGWGWRFKGAGAALAAGLRVEEHRLSEPDPGNAAAGTSIGAYVTADLWAKPSPGWLVTAQANATTVFSGYFLRATAARSLHGEGEVRLGAEAALLGSDSYRQMRLGALVSGIDLAVASLWASAGLMLDQDRRAGAYGSLGLWRKF